MLVILLATALIGTESPRPPSVDPRISKVRATTAVTVEASLPRVSLEAWLQSALGRAVRVTWRISDCDLKPDPPEPAEGYPVCVAAEASTPDRISVRLHFLVGTTKGTATDPQLFEGQGLVGCFFRAGGFRYGGVEHLADLSRALTDIRSHGECR
jgi:hypothetical protein